ncbi:2Fe-2S iron-sulfur cluster binding domain-containing protein [Alsobacter sp. SYSU M60028]|uniref:2Fe-2S iron-sulfur cluster binding domain-containing protein n=1 Tax=Alsobacter ponti TaxID=2962936 RepID=A0ABT1LI61_9HYPH|nr:2Fe-2S iron-sulfur cluster binding domain-containing protein [Alsobacter ponti]MCP8940583.1 2Fe-2S iron-sulfur cluster binding domain-containing protein [Alsobacter ponti]
MSVSHGPCTITVNGKRAVTTPGLTLVDAALSARVVVPHDCCTGQCETCRVTVLSGAVDDAGTRDRDTVLACQARVTGPVEIAFEAVPAVVKRTGEVGSVTQVAPDIFEVVVRLASRLPYLPGQYVKLAFAGLPERDYSPTVRLTGEADEHELVFHLRRYPDGLVSSQIGNRIRAGAKVKLRGPFGNAWLRPGGGPIVLVASGTGWAPIWSIAVAARLGQPERPLTVIASASDPANLYMRPALQWLWSRGVRDMYLASSAARGLVDVWQGRPTELVPHLSSAHDVYVAGNPDMVAAVKAIAAASGAACHTDPFTASTTRPSLANRIAGLFRTGASGSPGGVQQG